MDEINAVGLYMLGYYIQLSVRTYTDKESGERKDKYYVMVACGRRDAVNVGVSHEEYEELASRSLRPGMPLLMPIEAFAYKDKAYFRASGPVSCLADSASVPVSVT